MIMMNQGINKDCKIQNNSDYELMILNAVDNSNTEIIYEGSLTPLTTIDGSKTIAKYSANSIELNDYSETGTGEQIYNTLYDLILVQPTTLFPIENVSEMLSFTTNTYPDISVNNKNFDQMNSAFKFYQTVEAFPTSNLIKNFNAAMQKASAGNITGIDSVVDAFFASTDGFKNVTMNAYATVSSYIEVYPLVWLAGQENYTYYLYSPGQSSNGNKAAPTYQGKVTLNKIADVILDPNDYNSGCALTFTDPNNQNKQLYYVKGQFVDDEEADIPAICLKGSFVFKRNITYSSLDKQVIPFLIGTINNQQVMGSNTKQVGNTSESSWYVFWHPHSFKQWLQLFLNIFAIIFAVEFVCKTLIKLSKLVIKLKDKVRNEAENDNAEPSEAQLNQISDQANEINETNQEIVQDQLDQLTGSNNSQTVPDASEIEQTILDNRSEIQFNINNDRYRNFENLLDSQENTLQNLAEYGANEELEMAASNLETQEANLNSVSELLNSGDATKLTEINSSLDNINTGLAEVNNSISNISDDLSASLSEEVKGQVIEAQATAESVSAYEQEAKEAIESTEEGDVDPDAEIPDF